MHSHLGKLIRQASTFHLFFQRKSFSTLNHKKVCDCRLADTNEYTLHAHPLTVENSLCGEKINDMGELRTCQTVETISMRPQPKPFFVFPRVLTCGVSVLLYMTKISWEAANARSERIRCWTNVRLGFTSISRKKDETIIDGRN